MSGPSSWYYGLDPVLAYFLVLGLYWGLVNFLMWKPEGRFIRGRYMNLWLGDSPVALPLLMAGQVALVQRYFAGGNDFDSYRWHLGSIGLGLTVVVGMFFFERATDQYTLEEQLTPSKLAHTVLLGAGVWLIADGIKPAIYEWEWIKYPELCVMVGGGVWIFTFIHDTFFSQPIPDAHKTKKMLERQVAARA